jgi:hypothetical protein
MHIQQWVLLTVIATCGAAVIHSYINGLATHPGSSEKLWGNVSGALRIVNYVSMLLAVAGFFAFTYYIFFRLNPDQVRVAGYFTYWIFVAIYALILLPSAFWMPLTYSMIANPSLSTWIAVRTVLFLVGLGSLCLLEGLLTVQPRVQDLAYWLAVAGAAAFCLQTAVMDSFVWPANFRV